MFSGLVPSSVVLTAFQVASRLFLTWAITHSVPQVSKNLLQYSVAIFAIRQGSYRNIHTVVDVPHDRS